jgi:hypothetical protein
MSETNEQVLQREHELPEFLGHPDVRLERPVVQGEMWGDEQAVLRLRGPTTNVKTAVR